MSLFDPDGYWLNPFSGALEELVRRKGRRVNDELIEAMAEVLVSSEAARRGAMLPLQELQARMRSSGEVRRRRLESSQTTIHIDPELQRAGDAQLRMLSEVPAIPGYECAVDFVPHSSVSGDFYEVVALDHQRYLICIGDVSGHGLQAGLVVSNTLRSLRFLCRNEKDIVQLVSQLNDEIKDDLLPGTFVTLAAGVLDATAHTFTSVLAGHHPWLLFLPMHRSWRQRMVRPAWLWV